MKTKPLLRAIILGGGVALLANPVWAEGDKNRSQEARDRSYESKPNVDRLSQTEIERLQQALTERGQEPGGVDGVMGPATRQALAKFQRENDLKPTGSLNEQTAQQLGLEFSEVGGAAKNDNR